MLKNLGIADGSVQITPEALFEQITKDGTSFPLSNGWRLARVTVGGQQRVEIVGVEPKDFGRLDEAGAFMERIGFKPRYFIPNDPDQGASVIGEVLKYAPLVKQDSTLGTPALDSTAPESEGLPQDERASQDQTDGGAQADERSGGEVAGQAGRRLQDALRAAGVDDQGVQRAVRPGQSSRSTLSRSEQEQSLTAWARENGLILDGAEFDRLHRANGMKGGQEHEVVIDESLGLVTKRNYSRTVGPLAMNEDYADYLQRIQLHNELFPGTEIELAGFMEMPMGLAPVITQKFVRGIPMDRGEIERYMDRIGFRRVAEKKFRSVESDVIVDDLHEQNIIRDANGVPRVIDPIIRLEVPAPKAILTDAETNDDLAGPLGTPAVKGSTKQEEILAKVTGTLEDKRTVPQRIRDYVDDIRDYLAREFQQKLLDRFTSFKRLERETIGADPDKLDASVSAYKWARLTANLPSVMEYLLRHGTIAYKNGSMVQNGGKGLMQIVEPLIQSGKIRLWEGYVAAKRASRLLDEGKEKNFGKFQDPVTGEWSWSEDRAREEINALLELGNDHPEFEPARLEYVAFQKTVLDVAQAAGLIDPAKRALWEKSDYVPFYRIDARTRRLEHVAGTGEKGFTGNGGPAKAATLSGPKGVAVSPDGRCIYLADTESHTVRAVDLACEPPVMRLVAGDGERGDGPDSPAPTACRMARLHGLGVDAETGDLYIGDSETHKVRLVRTRA